MGSRWASHWGAGCRSLRGQPGASGREASPRPGGPEQARRAQARQRRHWQHWVAYGEREPGEIDQFWTPGNSHEPSVGLARAMGGRSSRSALWETLLREQIWLNGCQAQRGLHLTHEWQGDPLHHYLGKACDGSQKRHQLLSRTWTLLITQSQARAKAPDNAKSRQSGDASLRAGQRSCWVDARSLPRSTSGLQ